MWPRTLWYKENQQVMFLSRKAITQRINELCTYIKWSFTISKSQSVPHRSHIVSYAWFTSELISIWRVITATAWIGWVTGLSYCGINPTDSSFMDRGSTGGSGHLGFPFEDGCSLLLARYNCSSKIESLAHSSICLFFSKLCSKPVLQDFPGGPVIKTLSVQCRGLGSLPGQGTRSHVLKLKILHATTKLLYAAKKIPSVAAKAWHSQINK